MELILRCDNRSVSIGLDLTHLLNNEKIVGLGLLSLSALSIFMLRGLNRKPQIQKGQPDTKVFSVTASIVRQAEKINGEGTAFIRTIKSAPELSEIAGKDIKHEKIENPLDEEASSGDETIVDGWTEMDGSQGSSETDDIHRGQEDSFECLDNDSSTGTLDPSNASFLSESTKETSNPSKKGKGFETAHPVGSHIQHVLQSLEESSKRTCERKTS